MELNKVYSKFSISIINGKPVIISHPNEINVQDFVVEITGDTIQENIEKILLYVYDEIGLLSEGFISVCKGGYWGYCNLILKEVIEPKYNLASSVKEGFAIVSKGNKYDYIKMTGCTEPDIWTDLEFETASPFSNGMACVKKDGLYGYINNSDRNKCIIPCIYEAACDFNREGCAVIKIGGKYGMINKKGELILEPIFDYYTSSYRGNYNASIGKKHYWLYKNGTFKEV